MNISQEIIKKMADPRAHEPNPDPVALTQNSDPSKNASSGVDYEPHPPGISIPPERQEIVNKITRLYSGSASETDMLVYTEKAIYDDPWSYCDDRYKIAGQWYGTSFSIFLGMILLIGEREDRFLGWLSKLKYAIFRRVFQSPPNLLFMISDAWCSATFPLSSNS